MSFYHYRVSNIMSTIFTSLIRDQEILINISLIIIIIYTHTKQLYTYVNVKHIHTSYELSILISYNKQLSFFTKYNKQLSKS